MRAHCPKNKSIETEVCIIGAGAAGITLAREFIGRPFRVSLLESGGFEFDSETQSLYEGSNVGRPYHSLDAVRGRFFGGTTNYWAGNCRPLDEIDFEPRPWVPYSGWPFDRAHLVPYYQRAQPICQLGPFAYNPEPWDPTGNSRLQFKGDRIIHRILQHSPPTRFGQVYKDDIARATNVVAYLNANVVEVETNETAGKVTQLRVACLQGSKFWVRAKVFILATGGIENPRLLLLSNGVQKTGLGNQHDLVGRFFMEHVGERTAVFLPLNPEIDTAFHEPHNIGKISVMGFLSLAREVQQREKLLNLSVSLSPLILSLRTAASVYGKPLLESARHTDFDAFTRHLGYMLADLDDIAVSSYRHLSGSGRPLRLFQLRCTVESAPNPHSRVTLAPERDILGKNRVRLDWRLSELEKRSLERSLEILATEVGRAGLGRIHFSLRPGSDWTSPGGPHHHMGTTRMSADPKKGVVNENCRVHGVSNLFVAGSSVFPTFGYAHPTLTIVTLAIRLADHVKSIIKNQSS